MWEGGVPLPTGEGHGGSTPSPEFFFFDFGSPNSDFWCIVGAIFTVQSRLFWTQTAVA